MHENRDKRNYEFVTCPTASGMECGTKVTALDAMESVMYHALHLLLAEVSVEAHN
jgi:hypothetical protein